MRQGDLPSVFWFAYGIDPLVIYLDKRLLGITIYSTPMLGPTLPAEPPLPNLQEKFRLLAYVDDIKPAITAMHEFSLVDKASLLFEKASGCELHRDPASGKVKFLPLGRWRNTLQQEDIPLFLGGTYLMTKAWKTQAKPHITLLSFSLPSRR